MGRIAGDDPGYTFRLCRSMELEDDSPAAILAGGKKARVWTPTDHGFDMVSVSTFLGDVMGKPASAMSWWGFRIGLTAIAEALVDDVAGVVAAENDPEALEAFLKARGINPNMRLEEAGDRGSEAHTVLELLVAGDRGAAELKANFEEAEFGTRYGWAVIEWWDAQIAPFLESGQILQVLSEVPVWYLGHGWELRWAGTFDLAIEWYLSQPEQGWEICDLKTHKPASGFTKEGRGPAYISDVAQIRAYRMGFEWMGLGRTIGQRTIVARDRAYKKVSWLEDYREVPESFVLRIREAFNDKFEFEKGAVDG